MKPFVGQIVLVTLRPEGEGGKSALHRPAVVTRLVDGELLVNLHVFLDGTEDEFEALLDGLGLPPQGWCNDVSYGHGRRQWRELPGTFHTPA